MMIIVDIGYRRPLHVLVGCPTAVLAATSLPGAALPSLVVDPGEGNACDNGNWDESRDNGLGYPFRKLSNPVDGRRGTWSTVGGWLGYGDENNTPLRVRLNQPVVARRFTHVAIDAFALLCFRANTFLGILRFGLRDDGRRDSRRDHMFISDTEWNRQLFWKSIRFPDNSISENLITHPLQTIR
jgi:hypothetical protein